MTVNCDNSADPNAAVKAEPPARTIDRTEVFLRQNSRWADIDGVKTAPAHAVVTIPSEIAEIAFAVGNALAPKSEVAQRLLAGFGCAYARPPVDQCVDLAGAYNPDRGPRRYPIFGRRLKFLVNRFLARTIVRRAAGSECATVPREPMRVK